MFTVNQLDYAFKQSLSVINFKGGFDTFKFRKGFEEDTTISIAEKEEILDYLETNLPKGGSTYQAVKQQIDQEEFLSTDYYSNPYPRKFIGAYAPVVYKTIAGLMAMSL